MERTNQTLAYSKRPRRSQPKVKTGCINCNNPTVRRIKCDETKPHCVRCTGTGRKCDGYSFLGGTPNPNYGQNSSTPPHNGIQTLILATPDLRGLANDQERRSFDFFQCRTAGQLSGFFDTSFWTRFVLRATQHEAAIKHAVLALGALHERFDDGEKSVLQTIWNKGEGGFALTQYNKAIQQLVKPAASGQRTVDVCLIACVLFSCFETLRGHHGSALSHITSGVKILSEVRDGAEGRPTHGSLTVSAHPYVGLESLEVLFNRLNTQVAQMVGCPPMQLKERTKNKEPGFGPDIPNTFCSLEEARNSLDWNWTSCIQHMNAREGEENLLRQRDPLDISRHLYGGVMEKSLRAFRGFLRNFGKSLDNKSLQAARTLEISQAFAMIFLDMQVYEAMTDETVWDQYTERMEKVVSLGSLIVDSTSCDHIAQKCGPEFSLDMNILAPLYGVAHRCRHPAVRRKAVALLYAAPRQEGIWDSVLTARVAERLIHIEGEGLGNITCPQDVPDWARISDVSVKFDLQGRLGTINYSRQRSPLEKVRAPVTEELRW